MTLGRLGSSVSVCAGAGAHPLCGGTVRPGWRDGLHVGTGLASRHHPFGFGPAQGKCGLTGAHSTPTTRQTDPQTKSFYPVFASWQFPQVRHLTFSFFGTLIRAAA